MKSNRLALATSLSVMFLAAACAANKPAAAPAAASAESEPAAERAAAEPAKAKGKAPNPAPAGSPLAKITNGMADTDVRRILGEPTSSKSYQTGKQWIPYYYGPDTARTEYIYKGQGRITLTRNRYSGGLSVIRVDYDPGI
jgi:hypothetical protein